MVKAVVPDAAAPHLEEVHPEGETVVLVATATGTTACCPVCGRAPGTTGSRGRGACSAGMNR